MTDPYVVLGLSPNASEEEVKKVEEQAKSYEQLKELISVDTLKTMQLLGFNYKAAVLTAEMQQLSKFILKVA